MKALFITALMEFRDEEYLDTKKVLEGNGIEVCPASWNTGTARGKFGTEIYVDTAINKVDIGIYNVIVYIGGSGCRMFWDDPYAHKIAWDAAESRKVLSAICSAPVTLARAGLLRGRKCTCYEGDKEEIKKEGGIYTGAPVEQDGTIITADGPSSACAFGAKITEVLGRI